MFYHYDCIYTVSNRNILNTNTVRFQSNTINISKDKQLGLTPVSQMKARTTSTIQPLAQTNRDIEKVRELLPENKRLKQLEEFCKNKKRLNPAINSFSSKLSLLTKIKDKKVGYCLVPKAGSTTISLIMVSIQSVISQ